jgi:hypothetical protein
MRARDGRHLRGIATLILIVGCATPHLLMRLTRPSLYADDVVRIEAVRTVPSSTALARPFNEHLAPLFDLVTWASWRLCAGRLPLAPAVFTTASLMPAAFCAIALGCLIRRELGAAPPALAGIALFAASSVDLETFWWYSASSFSWALLGTILAWLGAARGGRSGAIVAGLATAAAPAFSGIGLLAGPIAVGRALLGNVARSRTVAAAAVLALLAYGALGLAVRHDHALTESLQRNMALADGLQCVARAPFVVLLPGLLGLQRLGIDDVLPPGLDVLLFLAAVMLVLAWARRHPQRPLILGGLLLIVGGYLLVYPFRVELSGGGPALRRIQRYHLFPRVGLILLLVAALPGLRRLGDRPALARWAPPMLAVALQLLHAPTMSVWSRFYAFPDQPATLAAIERLEVTCRRAGVTREQALRALDPIQTRWTALDGLNALRLLGPGAAEGRIPDERVRSTLLDRLCLADREAICGGMDATRYLRPAHEFPAEVAVGRLTRSARGLGGRSPRFLVPAFQEYELVATASQPARAVLVPASRGGTLELWWADRRGPWSPRRSLRWTNTGDEEAVALPLEHLPHWEATRARRLRVVLRRPGQVALGTPRLAR